VEKNIKNVVEPVSKKNLSAFVIPILIAAITIGLYVLAFPPFKLPEFAYFFSVPFLIWVNRANRFRGIIISVIIAITFFSWFILLFWLRHVTWGGLIALSALMAAFHIPWYLVAAKVFRNLHTTHYRLLKLCGLAGLWVSLEWTRGFIHTGLGFPWLTLGITQWTRPIILQIASLMGAYGVSFILIFFNLTLASYLIGLIHRIKKTPSINNTKYDLFAAILSLVFVFLFFVKNLPQKNQEEFLFKAAIIQPNIPGTLKWDANRFKENLSILKTETLKFTNQPIDVIIWPETALPVPIKGDDGMQVWTESLVNQVNKLLWLGSLAQVNHLWYNSLLIVLPQSGLQDEFYSKRKRVLFGEYVPLRNWFPFVNKFIPVDWDIAAGQGSHLLDVRIHDLSLKMGGLVCFEDIFPELSRASVRDGADFFLVVTNNAWYGEEWCAYQHAAHSILRAVETRRPFIRCGNAGWSGWIDEWGVIRQVTEQNNTIYFRGTDTFEVFRNKQWIHYLSPYVRYGDWFVYICFGLVLLSFIMHKKNEIKGSV